MLKNVLIVQMMVINVIYISSSTVILSLSNVDPTDCLNIFFIFGYLGIIFLIVHLLNNIHWNNVLFILVWLYSNALLQLTRNLSTVHSVKLRFNNLFANANNLGETND